MFPLLFQIGPFPVHTYGLMIAIGFFVSVSMIRRLSQQSGLDPQKMADFAFWFLLVGFIGARSLFVITRWSDFAADPLAIFKIWEGGLVFFGGPLLAVPFGIWMVHRSKISGWKGIDIFLPPIAIAHAFGRLGCLAAGCCYGRPTDLPWAVRLNSELVDKAHRGVALHPVQLYEAVALTLLFAGLLWLFPRKKFDGQVGLSYLLAYPIVRSIIEEFRGDSVRGFVIDGFLSTSQFISLVIFLVALIALIWRVREVNEMRK
ncbi:MAG: prolipoprotein diacylglyceryl transferase [Bdellovibrionales bacterium]|nr:prolipoprotein diacylglyceryl transferase [Bdellovibrionales bacterium]